MTTLHFKRHFDESRIEENESWGICDFYFETDINGEVLRQIEVYESGPILKYSVEFNEDEYGFLADQPINLSDFKEYSIHKSDFELQWIKK